MEARLSDGRRGSVTERLCRVDDIPDPGARGFSLPSGDGAVSIFVVRVNGQFYGYVNACPHIGTPLEFLPDRFLTRDGTEILCSTHGARFTIATGFCVAGPCKGRSLRHVALRVTEGWLEAANTADRH